VNIIICYSLPGDPADRFVLSLPSENISDTPKSTILTVPSFEMSKLSGFERTIEDVKKLI